MKRSTRNKAVRLEHNSWRDGGGRATVTPGKLDKGARWAFSWGHCHSFALALHEATGWDVVEGYFFDPVEGIGGDVPPACDSKGHIVWGVPGHMACRAPDNHIVDVTGPFIEGQISDMSEDFGPATWYNSHPDRCYDLASDGEYRPLEAVELARTLIKPLLKAYDLERLT